MKKFVFIALIAIGFMSCSDDETTNTVTLTQIEEEDLLTLREEEKLARDVYLYAFDKYGLDISNNISQSEQTHMDKILDLINTYGLEDPALPNRGEFTNQTLQTLYNDLTAQVDISELQALVVGATIEDLDIKDIEEFEARTDKSDILNVYNKLRCGSRNHMRSYYSQLVLQNYIYEALFITSTELADIVISDNEQCGRN
jgi:hypothetical protein